MFRLPTLFRAAATPKPAAPASIARLSQCARLRSEGEATSNSAPNDDDDNNYNNNNKVLAAAALPASAPAPASAPVHESKTVALAPTTRPDLPYFVLRTGSAKLPVYSEVKCGGTLRQTKVRKISGDVRALKNALQTELGLDPSEVKINYLTEQILVKGDRKMEIQTWLIAKGF